MTEKACPAGCVGVVISPSDGYCYKCGAGLVARPKCEKCTRPYLALVERFCPTCGNRLPSPPLLGAGAQNAFGEQAQKKVEGAA